MTPQPSQLLRPSYAIADETARFMSRVYLWMTGGILVSGALAYGIGTNEGLLRELLSIPFFFGGLMIAQLGTVLAMSFLINRLNAATATALYVLYAALTGVTMSVIFAVYQIDGIAQVFGLTAFSFAGLTAVGYATKRDLGPIGSFCTMGLFGLVGFSILSIFFPSLNSGVSGSVAALCGVIIFAGLTAYDTQKIKQLGQSGGMVGEAGQKAAVFGALTLYLDFVNLFLQLLRLMGRRK